jgi:hypothetical protein
LLSMSLSSPTCRLPANEKWRLFGLSTSTDIEFLLGRLLESYANALQQQRFARDCRKGGLRAEAVHRKRESCVCGGVSSGAMMTELLLAVYPDVFKAGSEFSGTPAGCGQPSNRLRTRVRATESGQGAAIGSIPASSSREECRHR